MEIPDTSDEPLFQLVTQARTLADMLASMGMARNADVVRELIKRVVPIKVIPTRGRPMSIVSDPIAPPDGKVFCAQCDRLVSKGCGSQFCKVVR